MCGIAGLYSRDGTTPPSLDALAGMSGRLAHRGPDGDGVHAEGPVALASRRLALLDLEHGGQPIASEDGSIVVACNGELYDHGALRTDLARRGHRFRTASDVEVLVHRYEERGLAFAEGLRGMFALALWDARDRRLVLARDGFGIKPMLYADDGRRLAFASELDALLALDDLPRDIDRDALEQYLALGAVMSPRTMLRAVRKLPAGHLLVADTGGVRITRFARPGPPQAAEMRREPLRELAQETRERLRASVKAHLQADVEVGVLLSGGVDSGLVTALAAAEAGHPVRTFTIGFEERSFDELAAARTVSRRYGTVHRELTVTPADAVELLPRIMVDLDEPRADATALPYWLLARMAAQDVKAVLSGEGGDELFGGYQTYVADLHAVRAVPLAAAMGPLLAGLPSSSSRLSLDFRLRRLARGRGLDALERHHAWKELLADDARGEILGPAARGEADPLDAYRARYAETRGSEPIARLQDVDLGTFLADDLLLQSDRAGMAHALEVRVPFLDAAVAELALALPRRARVRGTTTKRVLREAAAPLLPRAAVRGPKRGFVAPAAAWLRGPLLPFAREVLSPATLRRQGWFRPEAVTGLLDRHAARREDLARPLWALIAFTLWHEAHVEASPPSRPVAAPSGTLPGR